jgi:hypothetical protein
MPARVRSSASPRRYAKAQRSSAWHTTTCANTSWPARRASTAAEYHARPTKRWARPRVGRLARSRTVTPRKDSSHLRTGRAAHPVLRMSLARPARNRSRVSACLWTFAGPRWESLHARASDGATRYRTCWSDSDHKARHLIRRAPRYADLIWRAVCQGVRHEFLAFAGRGTEVEMWSAGSVAARRAVRDARSG